MTIKHQDRYETRGLIETQFEANSQNRVLKNLLGISKKSKIDLLEYESLVKASKEIFSSCTVSHRFTTNDIKKIHKIWLGKIYPWAGKFRQINLSKNGFHFAAANQIPKLIKEFEKKVLKKFTPCNFDS